MSDGRTPPLISVIIPCFNAAPFLSQTLNSVSRQTWSDLEIILVDDGSTDGSAEIASAHGDSRLSLIRQDNRGQTAALNVGLSAASGDYVQYLDADDLLRHDKIEIQIGRLLTSDRCVATSEWTRFQDDPESVAFEPRPNWKDLEPLDWFYEDWRDGGSMMFPALWLIPMSIIRAAGPWNETLTLNNDAEYFTRVILAAERILFCEGARVYYRSGLPTSLSGLRTRAGWVSQVRVLEACQRAILAREDSDRMRRVFSRAWQIMAQKSYPFVPDIAEDAILRARDLHSDWHLPIGGGAFAQISKLVGWKLARRLQHWRHGGRV